MLMLLREAMGVHDKIIIKKEPDVQKEETVPPLPAMPVLPRVPPELIDAAATPEIAVPPVLTPSAEPDMAYPSPAKKPHMSDMVVCLGESKQPRGDMIEQEVNRYIAAAQTDTQLSILKWWAKHSVFYPRLSVLAKKYLCIPASSVSSERVFSLAGHLVNKKRARMSPSHVDTFHFLKQEYGILLK